MKKALSILHTQGFFIIQESFKVIIIILNLLTLYFYFVYLADCIVFRI